MATITTLLQARATEVKPHCQKYCATISNGELTNLKADATRIMRDAAYARAETIKARRQWGVRPTSVDEDCATLRRLAYTVFECCNAELEGRI